MLKAKKLFISEELEDEGMFGVYLIFAKCFLFPKKDKVYTMLVCRDEANEPDEVFFVINEDEHGFYSKEMTYTIESNVLTLILPEGSSQTFYTGAKTYVVEVPEDNKELVKCKLKRVFDYGHVGTK